MFQFTHPGGVRHAWCVPGRDGGDVSIHAPGRGATATKNHLGDVSDVSIHAPGRGATDCRAHYVIAPGVSIHAPGRGATSSSLGSFALT